MTSITGDDHHFWIGTDGGLIQLKLQTGEAYNFNEDNSGLPCSHITCLSMDAAGNKWIGTKEGLACFDGRIWTVFNPENSPLPHDEITTIDCDPNNVIWIGTNEGLFRKNGDDWTVFTRQITNWLSDYIEVVKIAPNGAVWVSTSEELTFFENNSWRILDREGFKDLKGSVNNIVFDSQGDIWITTRYWEIFSGPYGDGLGKFDGNSWTIYKEGNSCLPTNSIDCLAVDENNNLWLGTSGGLIKFDGNECFTEQWDFIPGFITAIHIEYMTSIWVGSEFGLYYFNGTLGYQFITGAGLADFQARDVSIDRENNIWFFNGDGIVRFNGIAWKYYSNPALKTSDRKWLTAITFDQNNTLWCGAKDQLWKFDGKNWSLVKTFDYSGYDQISTMTFDKNNNIWIGFTDSGIATNDGTGWNHFTSDNTALPDNAIYAMLCDGENKIWVGSGKGITVYDRFNWRTFTSVNSELQGSPVRSIAIDSLDQKWIAVDNTLVRFDDIAWEVYTPEDSNQMIGTIRHIAIDKRNVIWASTPQGVARFDGSEWTVLNKKNSGLMGDDVTKIAIDQQNAKWIITQNCVSVYRGDSNNVAVEREKTAPVFIKLKNFPNPFNFLTTIEFSTAKRGNVEIEVYNVLGERIKKLFDRDCQPGTYNVRWDGTDQNGALVASGMYMYVLRVDFLVCKTQKLLLLK